MTDRSILYAGAFARALAIGMVSVLIGLHLARVGLTPSAIGVIVGAGLFGGGVAALLTTRYGDRFGRRRVLIALATLGALGGVVVAAGSTPWVLGVAAFLGMLNGMGRDRGASLILDQVILPATAADAGRTRLFAIYNVVQDSGHALGGLCAGLPSLFERAAGVDPDTAFRGAIGLYAAILALTALLYRRLSPEVEPRAAERPRPLAPESRRRLARIASLFAVDSLAGGFLTSALLAVFLHERFGAGEAAIGALFFGARAANALSHIAAAWIARRIGLVNTMVFTHIPSSLLLMTVPVAPSFPVAAALFLLREGLVEMDVPTRQSYVMAIFPPEERTTASGVTHLVRLLAWSVAPSFAGALMQGVSMGTPLYVGAAMKIGYDVLLWTAFRRLPPPEERRAAPPA
ncbi:MAG TPA: MFS transporter [Dongiaceae bacterium]|nr:MFS transporter [Dongiaceae bacterium]